MQKGVTYFLIEGEEPEIKVVVKRNDQVIDEKPANSQKEAEKIRGEFVNEFWK